jgi:hypothetical protein
MTPKLENPRERYLITTFCLSRLRTASSLGSLRGGFQQFNGFVF